MDQHNYQPKIDALLPIIQREMPDMKWERNALMAGYTTLHLGGEADLLVQPSEQKQIGLLLREAKRLHLPVTVLGHGSNMLVRDGGIRGLVIRLGREMNRISVVGDTVQAEAGVMLSTLAMAAADHNLGGLTFASGIPGTAGGGTLMNAGAYGGEMSQVVTRVAGFTLDGTPFTYSRSELDFGYRHSRLQEEEVLVTEVTCQLPAGNRADLVAEMVELNTRRAEKQPLTLPSAGSTFKRPANGYAAQMIDEAGLRGFSIGGAQVSEKHAGFLVNRGGTSADFLALMAEVQRRVLEKFGVMLEPEVRILGEDPKSCVC